MISCFRPALALSLLLAPALFLAQACNQPSKPTSKPTSNRDSAAAVRPATAVTDDGLMRATISCPRGKPEYKIEGRQVIVNCPG